jgi:hypothetical protein
MNCGLKPIGIRYRGITLLEVLISIGILSVGLASVISLIPAGGLQASRAILLDRGSAFAANLLADAATFGMLSPECVQNMGTYTFFDPDSSMDYLRGTQRGQLKARGLFSVQTDVITAGPSYERLALQARDDIRVTPPRSDDEPPTNNFDGNVVRSFDGRFTALLGLSGTAAGVPQTMSAVIFHRRDTQNSLAIDAEYNGLRIAASSLNATQLGDRRFQDIIKPGMVIWDGAGRFHQAASVTVDRTNTFAYVTLTSGALVSGTIQLLPDSVGLATRMYVPEYGSRYRQ